MAPTARRRIPDYHLYGEAPRVHDERTLHVESIEARSARHQWRIDAHQHRSLNQLMLVIDGGGIAAAEGRIAHFDPPALVLVPSGTVHGFEFEPHTHGYVVTLSDELLMEAARREPALTPLFRAPQTLSLPARHRSTGALVHAVQLLAAEHAAREPGRALALEGAMSLLLVDVLRAVQAAPVPEADSPSGRHRELAARFRAAIEASFRRGTTIPAYARELQVSESQLRKACLEATGRPPIHLLHARIMLEAKRQLFYTSRPIAEIAFALGFDDPAYFSRFFTRRAGKSPRAFRADAGA